MSLGRNGYKAPRLKTFSCADDVIDYFNGRRLSGQDQQKLSELLDQVQLHEQAQ